MKVLWEIPDQLHTKLKVQAAKEGKKLYEIAIEKLETNL